MLPLLTGAAKEELESVLPDMKDFMEENPELKQMIELTFGPVLGGSEVVSSEYVGDEFHFRVRTTLPQFGALIEPLMRDTPEELRAELLDEMPELPESVENVVKMRKEDGAWRIYE